MAYILCTLCVLFYCVYVFETGSKRNLYHFVEADTLLYIIFWWTVSSCPQLSVQKKKLQIMKLIIRVAKIDLVTIFDSDFWWCCPINFLMLFCNFFLYANAKASHRHSVLSDYYLTLLSPVTRWLVVCTINEKYARLKSIIMNSLNNFYFDQNNFCRRGRE